MTRQVLRMVSSPELREAAEANLHGHFLDLHSSQPQYKPVPSSSRESAALTESALKAHQQTEAQRHHQKQRRRAATVPREGAENRRPAEYGQQISRHRLASESRLRPPPQQLSLPPPLPSHLAQRSRTLQPYGVGEPQGLEVGLGGWEAASSLTGSSSRSKGKVFEMYQPVTVTIETKSSLPWSKDKKSKQHRAIIVDCIDEFTYSVRIIPKSYPTLAAQYYRWHWFHGDKARAIKEGAEAHKAGKWELVEKLHVSQIVRASKKVVLDL